ncbi:MAG: hypothetical protein RL291_162 [Pseudomonadota bacterium]
MLFGKLPKSACEEERAEPVRRADPDRARHGCIGLSQFRLRPQHLRFDPLGGLKKSLASRCQRTAGRAPFEEL